MSLAPSRAAVRHRTIAERLYVSVKTVANNVSAVMLKLGVEDRADAILATTPSGLFRSRRTG